MSKPSMDSSSPKKRRYKYIVRKGEGSLYANSLEHAIKKVARQYTVAEDEVIVEEYDWERPT